MSSVPTGAVTGLLSRLVVHVAYFTDPLCPWSWGAEPHVRRLEVEFSGQVRITYVMAGMSREIDAARKVASTLDVVAETGMPADPRVWISDPPRSSHPSCVAVKAAAEQGLDGPYLRRLREGVMVGRERLDHDDALLAAARDVPGLDPGRFESDLRSEAVAAQFAAERQAAAAACGDHRPWLPAFSVDCGPVVGVAELRDAVVVAGAEPGPLPSPEEALARFATLSTAELGEVCGLSPLRVRVELWRAAGELRLRPRIAPFGELWQTG